MFLNRYKVKLFLETLKKVDDGTHEKTVFYIEPSLIHLCIDFKMYLCIHIKHLNVFYVLGIAYKSTYHNVIIF